MPSYEIGSKWKNAEVGKFLSQMLAEKGVLVVTWIWQAGGVASRTKPLVTPDDAKGMKVRGGSREMDMMFKDAGSSVLSLPSNEIYAAMQTGAMDAALTSSTSLISFRLEEVSKALTSGRGKSYWFMFEPLMMSKQVFDKLPKAQQDAIMAVGAELEKFAVDSAKADDDRGRGGLCEGGREGSRPRRRGAREMAGAGEAGVEGLRRQERELREAARRCPEAAVSAAPAGARAMSHGVDGTDASRTAGRVARHHAGALGALERAMTAINRVMLFVGMVALVAASLVLTYSVFSRYLFKAATDWQDEVAVFMHRRLLCSCAARGCSRCAATSASRRSPTCCRRASTASASSWSTSSRCCSAPSSRGSPGRCSMKRGSTR